MGTEKGMKLNALLIYGSVLMVISMATFMFTLAHIGTIGVDVMFTSACAVSGGFLIGIIAIAAGIEKLLK